MIKKKVTEGSKENRNNYQYNQFLPRLKPGISRRKSMVYDHYNERGEILHILVIYLWIVLVFHYVIIKILDLLIEKC
jgi:hypothetical protein